MARHSLYSHLVPAFSESPSVRNGRYVVDANQPLCGPQSIASRSQTYSHTRIAAPHLAGEDDGPDYAPPEGDLAVEEAKPAVKKPPLYKVILLNDDYTPMEFVVEVLEVFFRMNREQATQVMLTVHTRGKGVCGIYTRDIAETKMNQVNQYARENQHPLLCEVEASDA